MTPRPPIEEIRQMAETGERDDCISAFRKIPALVDYILSLETEINAAVAVEREANAKIADAEILRWQLTPGAQEACTCISNNIRAGLRPTPSGQRG